MLTRAGTITRACGCMPVVTLMAPSLEKLASARERLEASFCRPCGDGFRRGKKSSTWGGGLAPGNVRVAKGLLAAGRTVEEVSLETGINRTMVGMVKRGERWANV